MTTPKLHVRGSVLRLTARPDCYSHPLGGEGSRPRCFTMRRFNLFIALLSALAISASGLIAAAPALAYNISTVYKDCESNGQLTGHYPRAELQAALNSMPSEVAEYSACSDIIRMALLRASSHGGGNDPTSKTTLAAGGHSGGGGNGGSGTGSARVHGKTGSSSKDPRAAGTAGSNPVDLAGSSIRPGSTGTGGAASSLPIALVVVLILLALTALSGGAVAIRRRVVARHGT
ncbi:MAG: hypothetical protein QOJ25_2232 [Solirubrobacteraceae bacterium]|nr:hypothetical protein [Solirubrobacteraceae bacterium]